MNRDWLDIGVLEDYLDGKLDAKTMNRVEREALDDPFVAEALAGLSESPKRSLQSLSLLQKQLHQRIAEQHHVKETSVITWQRLSIAATAAVMFVAVSIMFWMRENNQQKELAGRPKKVDVTIAPITPATERAVVQAAPVTAGEQADRVREAEIDRAVRAAKINTYAARVKKSTRQPVPEAAPRQQLNEDAVVGYPMQRKQNVTGAVASARTLNIGNVLSGRVIAQDDGKPLPGVSVTMPGTYLTAVTDINGEFKINADTSVKEGKLRVSYLGFKATEMVAKANQAVNITLAPDNSALNEVMVTSFGKAKKSEQAADSDKVSQAINGKTAAIRIRGIGTVPGKKDMVSNPVEGWDRLWTYLEQNNAFKNEKKTGQVVAVSFKIDRNGRPADIRIEKGADDKYEQEAIRLIMNGPKWEQPQNSSRRMNFQIDF